MNKCKDCIWGTWYASNKVYCTFLFCIKEDEKVIKDAKKTIKTLRPSRMFWVNCKEGIVKNIKGKLIDNTTKETDLIKNSITPATGKGYGNKFYPSSHFVLSALRIKELPQQRWWITLIPTKVMKAYSLISVTYNPSASPATIGRLLRKMADGKEEFIPTNVTDCVAADAGVGAV